MGVKVGGKIAANTVAAGVEMITGADFPISDSDRGSVGSIATRRSACRLES